MSIWTDIYNQTQYATAQDGETIQIRSTAQADDIPVHYTDPDQFVKEFITDSRQRAVDSSQTQTQTQLQAICQGYNGSLVQSHEPLTTTRFSDYYQHDYGGEENAPWLTRVIGNIIIGHDRWIADTWQSADCQLP